METLCGGVFQYGPRLHTPENEIVNYVVFPQKFCKIRENLMWTFLDFSSVLSILNIAHPVMY